VEPLKIGKNLLAEASRKGIEDIKSFIIGEEISSGHVK